jgi:hypothetical protein
MNRSIQAQYDRCVRSGFDRATFSACPLKQLAIKLLMRWLGFLAPSQFKGNLDYTNLEPQSR